MSILNHKEVPGEISTIYLNLKGIKNISNFDYKTYKRLYGIYHDYLKNLFKKWFKKYPGYSDEYIAEQLFYREVFLKDMKNNLKIKFYGLIKSLERENVLIKKYYNENIYDPQLVDELSLLKEMIFESIPFLNWIYEYTEGAEAGYRWMKRTEIHSQEVFSSSQMLLRNNIYHNSIGEYVVRPTAIFLIRQAIEIRIKNVLGIDYITDDKGKMLKLPGEIFIEIIKTNSDDILFPVKTSIVLKIHNWSNYYIHGGTLPNIWEIEWAHYILTPLFSSGKYKDYWNLFGSVKITKHFYDEINDKIKEIICRNGSDPNKIYIMKLNKPECFIVDNI